MNYQHAMPAPHQQVRSGKLKVCSPAPAPRQPFPQAVYFRTAGMGSAITQGEYGEQFSHSKSGEGELQDGDGVDISQPRHGDTNTGKKRCRHVLLRAPARPPS